MASCRSQTGGAAAATKESLGRIPRAWGKVLGEPNDQPHTPRTQSPSFHTWDPELKGLRSGGSLDCLRPCKASGSLGVRVESCCGGPARTPHFPVSLQGLGEECKARHSHSSLVTALLADDQPKARLHQRRPGFERRSGGNGGRIGGAVLNTPEDPWALRPLPAAIAVSVQAVKHKSLVPFSPFGCQLPL